MNFSMNHGQNNVPVHGSVQVVLEKIGGAYTTVPGNNHPVLVLQTISQIGRN
jgi:hypothetical protein